MDSNASTTYQLNRDLQRELLHPREASRLAVAAVTVVMLSLFALAVIVASAGVFLFVLALVLASIWFARKVLEARLKGGALEVNHVSFPDVYETILDVCNRLGYTKSVDMYIVQDGEVNATLMRLFGKRILWLNSGLLEAMRAHAGRAELEFIVGRFIGALQAKHLRLGEFMAVVGAFEKLWVANLTLLPYHRATVLSGDRLGLAVCGDPDAAIRALNKLFIGKGLAEDVSTAALRAQAAGQRTSVFWLVSVLFSEHPHFVERYVELLDFIDSPMGHKLNRVVVRDTVEEEAPSIAP